MAEDMISIGIALDTSQVLQGHAGRRGAQASGGRRRQHGAVYQSHGSSRQDRWPVAQAASFSGTGRGPEDHRHEECRRCGGAGDEQNLAMAVAAAAQSMIQAQREAKKVEDELRRVAKATEEAEKAAALASITLGQKLGGAFRDVGQQAKRFAVAQVGVSSLQSVLSGVVNFAQRVSGRRCKPRA